MSRQGIANFTTPQKAWIKGAADYMDHLGIKYSHNDLFKYHGMNKQQGWAILKEDLELANRTHHNSEFTKEQRRRPLKLSAKDLECCDRFLQDVGWDARVLTWDQLSTELDCHVCGNTLCTHLGSMDYMKCVACTKGWVSQKLAKKRISRSEDALKERPQPDDWKSVRFSDEVHWRVGPQGKMCIIRKPGERYCSDCIQEQLNRNDEKQWEAAHTWATIGYNFKSNLTFYNTPGNKNGKLSLRVVYRDQILEPVVKPWLVCGDTFTLEEDNDSGHGGGSGNNIVAIWKHKNKLDSYFNCPNSPDLAPIENCWQPPKQYLKQFPHWDEFETRELAYEGWQKQVTQQFINERVLSMPQRLTDCIEMEGRITDH
ncbi:hypothetical protein BU25DRAFT_465246 [Macroventuria anomochaeta]|uniref:Uncharacterized protein n=1 Tax=Macroventuria anomochaeta TaxID=301207 RepID=A0ACB6S6P5_9PLEO|nr:uncharacterized protein BU25DRAFT_465246 [Macroventuria anomochaeta]KAF2629187.1 hypothetical protein BU25DRAFT_465246 [Macroventuria anomochaeta]